MKLKKFLCLLSLCGLLAITAIAADSGLVERVEIKLSVTDEPFTMPNGREKEPRSIPMLVPFSAFLSESHSIELDFYEAIGEIEIIISQNGDVIYSSSENVVSPILKNIQLPQGSSGVFLLEIRNGEGAYAFGNFDL